MTWMVPNVAGIIVKPVDFAVLPACALVVNRVLSTRVHQVAPKLNRKECSYHIWFSTTNFLWIGPNTRFALEIVRLVCS